MRTKFHGPSPFPLASSILVVQQVSYPLLASNESAQAIYDASQVLHEKLVYEIF